MKAFKQMIAFVIQTEYFAFAIPPISSVSFPRFNNSHTQGGLWMIIASTSTPLQWQMEVFAHWFK